MAARWPQGGCQVAARWPPNGRQMAAGWPPDGRQLAARWPPDGRQMAARWPLGGRKVAAGGMPFPRREFPSILHVGGRMITSLQMLTTGESWRSRETFHF